MGWFNPDANVMASLVGESHLPLNSFLVWFKGDAKLQRVDLEKLTSIRGLGAYLQATAKNNQLTKHRLHNAASFFEMHVR